MSFTRWTPEKVLACARCHTILFSDNILRHVCNAKSSKYDPKKTRKAVTMFRCDFCSIIMRQSGNMQTHRNSHTGEKPYVCPHVLPCEDDPSGWRFCMKKFGDPGQFTKHRRTKHGYLPRPRVPKSPLADPTGPRYAPYQRVASVKRVATSVSQLSRELAYSSDSTPYLVTVEPPADIGPFSPCGTISVPTESLPHYTPPQVPSQIYVGHSCYPSEPLLDSSNTFSSSSSTGYIPEQTKAEPHMLPEVSPVVSNEVPLASPSPAFQPTPASTSSVHAALPPFDPTFDEFIDWAPYTDEPSPSTSTSSYETVSTFEDYYHISQLPTGSLTNSYEDTSANLFPALNAAPTIDLSDNPVPSFDDYSFWGNQSTPESSDFLDSLLNYSPCLPPISS
ncbi:hypothetical protein BDW22DRAFT_611308 [Trametopsis cervina]|nr:hypothetical protein BDW22DRAFT_611308 [Trametopsis cervina]